MRPKPLPLQAINYTRPVVVQAADAAAPDAARTFSLNAYTGEPMDIWPFEHPVVVDLSSVDVSVQEVPALYNHDAWINSIVGQVQKMGVSETGLQASGIFIVTSKDERDPALQVLAKADKGYKWQVSIGGSPSSLEEIKPGENAAVNGRTYPGPVIVAKGVRIREISFVVLGGDRRTSAIVARHKNPKRTTIRAGAAAMTFEEWLLSMGFDDPAALTEIQRANLQQQFAIAYPDAGTETETETATGTETTAADETATTTEDEEEIPPAQAAARQVAIQAALAQAAAAERRAAEIRNICATHGNPSSVVTVNGRRETTPIVVQALEGNWSNDRINLEFLRAAGQAGGPFAHVDRRTADDHMQALQGAMLMRANGRIDSPHYRGIAGVAMKLPQWLRAGLNETQKQRVLEQAHKLATRTLTEVCALACQASRIDIGGMDRDEMIRAAFSSSALTNVFTTNVNAILLDTYMQATDTTVGWVREADVNDYKTQERPRLLVGGGLKKLPRGGEADHAKYSDAMESYKIAKYASQFQVDEQDVVDDNFGIFSQIPVDFGNAAARLRPDLVYAILMAAPTLTATGRSMFHATEGNVQTSSALSAATLKTAIAKMRLFRENSVNLNITPSHLLVPPTLEDLAYELVSSAFQIITGTTDSTRGSVNALQRHGLTVVADARLENGVIDPTDESTQTGSASTWFTAAAMAHTIEVGYLAGTGRAPRVRSTILSQGKYGLHWDVDLSIGAKAMDWKGFVRSTA